MLGTQEVARDPREINDTVSDFLKLSCSATHEFWKVPVLFEDDHILAVDKPASLPASPDRSDPERPSLVKLLHAVVSAKKPWAMERGLGYLMNAHRLDEEATGVLLLAKSNRVLVSLVNLFGSQKPVQTFLALVKGLPIEDSFKVEVATAQDMALPGRMRVQPQNGNRTWTQFEVMERFRGFTLLKCFPLTERRHQIRVHLAHSGFPVCGDRTYRGKPLMLSRLKPNYRLKPNRTERPLIGSTALHAQTVAFDHPVTGQPILIEAPLPKTFQIALKYLRQYASDSNSPECD
jgi:RluA family pseudouridine synthase